MIVKIRSFTAADAKVCRQLYDEGPIDGKVADNDTGLDMDNIQLAYMAQPGGHFWVAESEDGQVVGMIGVQQNTSGEGEIRRLRVRKEHRRRGIGTALLEQAIKHCKEMAYLKVTLDTFMDPTPGLKLFERFQFKHSRTREVGDKALQYFYLDLYSGERPDKAKE